MKIFKALEKWMKKISHGDVSEIKYFTFYIFESLMKPDNIFLAFFIQTILFIFLRKRKLGL